MQQNELISKKKKFNQTETLCCGPEGNSIEIKILIS